MTSWSYLPKKLKYSLSSFSKVVLSLLEKEHKMRMPASDVLFKVPLRPSYSILCLRKVIVSCIIQLQLCQGDWKIFVHHLTHVLHNGMFLLPAQNWIIPSLCTHYDVHDMNSKSGPWYIEFICLLLDASVTTFNLIVVQFPFLFFPTLDNLLLICHYGCLLLPYVRWASKPTTWLVLLQCIGLHLLVRGLQCNMFAWCSMCPHPIFWLTSLCQGLVVAVDRFILFHPH